MNSKTHTIDATNKIIGRIAVEAAEILRGKHSPAFESYTIPQYKVIITNASHARITGSKEKTKVYKRFSGYPSGLRQTTYERQFEKDPRKIFEHAIRGMLPKNKLRSIMMKNLTIQP